MAWYVHCKIKVTVRVREKLCQPDAREKIQKRAKRTRDRAKGIKSVRGESD